MIMGRSHFQSRYFGPGIFVGGTPVISDESPSPFAIAGAANNTFGWMRIGVGDPVIVGNNGEAIWRGEGHRPSGPPNVATFYSSTRGILTQIGVVVDALTMQSPFSSSRIAINSDGDVAITAISLSLRVAWRGGSLRKRGSLHSKVKRSIDGRLG